MYLDSRLLIRLGGQFSAFNRCQPGNFLASGPTMRPLPPDFEYRFHIIYSMVHILVNAYTNHGPQATVLARQGGDAPSNAFSGGYDSEGCALRPTVHIPADTPHPFYNTSSRPTRLLCICSPAGQEEFFAEACVRVVTRTTPPPKLTRQLNPKYPTE